MEYGIKAQFPQTESTDYTIRGKQNFEVRGPRLKATKEQKTSVVYGKDNRLQVAVRNNQPRLNLSLEMPETLFQGELKCLDLFLTNCGNVPTSRLYLISHNPGLISFGKKGEKSASAGSKSLFDFPVITDASLSEQRENGSSVPKPLDYLPIPLEKESLAPGESVKIPIWIRGPEHLGFNDVKISCYYEKETTETLTKKRSYRIMCKNYKVKVLPSVAVSATRSDICVFDSQISETITVHVSNISKESSTAPSSKGLDEISISQVSLVSHDKQLQRLQSKNENLAVSRLDSSSINLKAVRSPGLEAQTPKVRDQTLKFSSVICKNVKGFYIQSAPFVDFLKPGFSFTDIKSSPKLEKDLVVVFWKGSSNSQVMGQLIVPLKQAKPLPSLTGDVPDGSRSSSSSAEDVKPWIAPKAAMQVKVKLQVQDLVCHDFAVNRICTVPCKLTVTNPNSSAGKFCARVDEFSAPSFLGCVNSDVIIGPNETLELDFMVAVTEPGLFQCKGLRFQMLPPNSSADDLTKSGLIPVDLSFVVRR